MDPLQDPSYLLSTIQVIADSLHERYSIHTLLDAYATFVSRLRSQGHLLEAGDTSLPALAPLSAHRDNFVRALERDVRLAHFDPFSTSSYPPASLDGASKRLNITIDTKQYARDSSLLCHHALCALTTMFRFPALQALLPEHDLSSLFGDILDIALADELPILNAAKTYSLTLWTLGCHQLPATVLHSRRDDILSALRRCTDGARQQGSIVLDGMKAVSYTVEHYPSPFLDHLFPLLPQVMTNLISKSFERRLHASITLGKFANALIHQVELSLTRWQSLSDHVTSFLESFLDQSLATSGETSFACMVRATFSAELYTRPTNGPAWILAVLASLIILCGPGLYAKPALLHSILQSLALALTHKRSVVRALHSHVWSCFVWTFNQMLLSSENVEPALISSAFYVIRQEVMGGIGMALTNVLLSDRIPTIRADERCDRVSQALLVINTMVRTECKHTRQEGFMFLRAFSNDTHVRHQILHGVFEIPASVLVDGTIVRADWNNLPSVIHSIPRVPVSVHWLDETEIARHYKTLLTIWKHLASKVDGKHLDSSLVDVWLFILLGCSHQLECEQLAPITEVLRYAAAIIVEFLPSVALGDCQPDSESWNIHDQLCILRSIDQLWSAMQKTFVVFDLAEIAELVLNSLLKHAFHFLDRGVRASWGRLCANLMILAPPSFLRDPDQTTSQLVIRNQRELWGIVATSLSSSEPSLDWEELVKVLSIPICTWVLSESELQAWEALLQNAITVSGDSAIVVGQVISQCFQGKAIESWDSVIPILGFLLTCEHSNSPTDELLFTVDVCLTDCYSRASHSPEALTKSLKLLNVIRHAIVLVPGNVMRVLRALRGSLGLWIEDHGEVMSDDEFNSVAVSLYCEALKALEVLPLSIQSLQDVESFLASAFSRIPAPATAPFAFEKFWRATYHNRTQFCNNLPPKIKACLSCFVAAFGGDLADGLPLTTGSQSQSINDGSQVYFYTGRPYRDVRESSHLVNPLSVSIDAEAGAETEVASHERQRMCVGKDETTFLISSPDGARQPSVSCQLQEYTNQLDATSSDGLERSKSSSRLIFSPIICPDGAISRCSQSPEKSHSHASNQKRKLATTDEGSQERSRSSRDTLRSVRKLGSEPATRDVIPVAISRTSSVPLKKRQVFDGVHVPTLGEILRRETVRAAAASKSSAPTRHEVPSSRNARRRDRTPQSPPPPSVGSDDDFDWENLRVDGTSSEIDVDRSLMNAQPSASSPAQGSTPHDSDDLRAGSSPPRAVLQSGCPPPAPPLHRTETRLDALRDVYSSVANGASQIPFPELVQATKLVHQIGAVLTEQMGKKMSNPK